MDQSFYTILGWPTFRLLAFLDRVRTSLACRYLTLSFNLEAVKDMNLLTIVQSP